jgi:hypothetical protein
MLKFENKTQPTNLSYSSCPAQESTNQLFVLVPSTEIDTMVLTQRVYELANAGAFHVKFMGLCTDAGNELVTRRSLISMSAMLNYRSVISDVEVILSNNWVDNLKSRVCPGDMVVYWATQPPSSLHRPLSQLLRENLNVPLYIIPGRPAPRNAHSAWTVQVAAWIGFIAIMLGFLFLQTQIFEFANGWTTVLALLSVTVEFWLIWVWHNWFN